MLPLKHAVTFDLGTNKRRRVEWLDDVPGNQYKLLTARDYLALAHDAGYMSARKVTPNRTIQTFDGLMEYIRRGKK